MIGIPRLCWEEGREREGGEERKGNDGGREGGRVAEFVWA